MVDSLYKWTLLTETVGKMSLPIPVAQCNMVCVSVSRIKNIVYSAVCVSLLVWAIKTDQMRPAFSHGCQACKGNVQFNQPASTNFRHYRPEITPTNDMFRLARSLAPSTSVTPVFQVQSKCFTNVSVNCSIQPANIKILLLHTHQNVRGRHRRLRMHVRCAIISQTT